MALWAKLQTLPGDALRQVQGIYNESFPIEVRCALAQWIEEKPWNEIEPDNPHHEQYAGQLVVTMIQEMENKMNSEENFLMRIKLHEAINYFRQNYSHSPMTLVRIVKNSLQTELKVIQHAENQCLRMSNPMQCIPDPHQEISQTLDVLRQKTLETDENLRTMQQEQESLVLQVQQNKQQTAAAAAQYNQMNAQPDMQGNADMYKIQKGRMDRAIQQRALNLAHMRMALSEKYQETFLELSTLQTRVLDDELIKWKRNQQLSGNGGAFENNLDQIQEWCEALAEIIWQNRQQIKRMELLCAQLPINLPPGAVDKLPALNTQITSLLSSLVTSTFIIEKQPPQVMKTNTRFTATVRLLVGGKLNVHMTPPQVKATIISEAQANALLKNDKMAMGDVSGEILNNTGSMEYHQATRQLSVSFRNMQLRKIKRAEKKGTESVMDEKFSLLFQSQFKVGGGELVFQVWTLSLPVVVIVHGNQEPHAWATVTWDNAFAEPGRVPFAVPDKVSWPQMAEVLSTKFKSATGKGLGEENLRFLAGKAFRSSQSSQVHDLNSVMVSWSQFCKEPLPDRNFTFWEWFYAIMKVTREHLRNLWNDGLILGFVGRRQAEDMLLKRCSGTFLLRYSDSELGGVTIAWVAEDQHQDGLGVFNLQPFTSRDFNIRSLADRINDLKHLTYLYPDIPKDQAFGKYYTPYNDNQPASNNGYVKPLLVAVVPGFGGTSNTLDSFPNTPHSYVHPQSPDASYSEASTCATDQVMNTGAPLPDLDCDLINMDFHSGDAAMAIDFSSINFGDLLAYSKQK